MHHYPHHIGDYRKNTGHLTNDQDLAYRRLLEMYYDTEQPIPLETQRVARRLRVDTESVDIVLSDFFTKTEGGWRHERCDDEIAKYYVVAERNRTNGKLGGRPKKTQSEPSGLPVATQSEPSGKATKNQEPRTNNQEPLAKPLRRKSAPMPTDFQINEVSSAYSADRNLNIPHELVAFANWHTAKGSTFKDWQAAWRTWCDKAVEFGRAKGGSPPRAYESEKDRSRREFTESIFGKVKNEPTGARDITSTAIRVD